LLVWRNRRGEATYCWKKLEEPKEEIHEELKAAEPKAMQTRAIPQVPSPPIPKVKQAPAKQNFPNLEEQSPRSTNSSDTAELTAADRRQSKHMNAAETAEMKAAGFGVTAGPVGDKQDAIAMKEVKMLVEMAGKRLLAGDVFMSMHYINLAQQVQPLSSSFSYDEEVTNCLA
jgi:type IV secretory pathway VirB10-like protein